MFRDDEVLKSPSRYLEALHTLRPASEYHEDFGTVLWFHLPIEEPPHVGTPNDSDWDEEMWCGSTSSEWLTHWLPLPECRMLTSSDGAIVGDQAPLPLPGAASVDADRLQTALEDLERVTKELKHERSENDRMASVIERDCMDSWDRKGMELRIAELEAALEKYGAHQPTCAYVQPRSGVGSLCFTANCDCGFDDVDEPAALDALLTQARRKALEGAAAKLDVAGLWHARNILRQMALEVKS